MGCVCACATVKADDLGDDVGGMSLFKFADTVEPKALERVFGEGLLAADGTLTATLDASLQVQPWWLEHLAEKVSVW
jgi:hypothetical protein